MKFSSLVEAYIRMKTAGFQKKWKKEVVATLKFVRAFDKLSDKKQIEFLRFMYDVGAYKDDMILLLRESLVKDEDDVDKKDNTDMP